MFSVFHSRKQSTEQALISEYSAEYTYQRLLCGLLAWVKHNWCILGVVVFNQIILYNY